MSLSKYQIILTAYKSRFIFRTDAEYRKTLGVSFETVSDKMKASNKDKKEDEREIDIFYDILDRECRRLLDDSLEAAMTDYLVASEAFFDIDWGARRQMASRKTFCRLLFRLVATGGMELSAEEYLKFKVKDDDLRLIQYFYPDSFDNPAVNVRLITLFTFGVISPWKGPAARGRDLTDKRTVESLRNFLELVSLLREDIPRIGSLEKPYVFNQWIGILNMHLNEDAHLPEVTPLWFTYGLTEIGAACRSLVNPEDRRRKGEMLVGLRMPGIWVDDSDGGKNRFWIFPDNIKGAFCYQHEGMGWKLIPYEFNCYDNSDPEYVNSCFFVTPKGNLNLVLTPQLPMDEREMAYAGYEITPNESGEEIRSVDFYDGPIPFPDWFDWRRFERLSKDDPRYGRLREVLNDIYDPNSSISYISENVAPTLTDTVNNIVGRDRYYLYISDFRRPDRFLIKENELELFTYEFTYNNGFPPLSLLNLEITEEHPLYAIPTDIKRKRNMSQRLETFVTMLEDADNINEAYILRTPHPLAPVLFFPSHGISIPLDMEELSGLGVLRFTSRSQFFRG
ncbi:MAG: hypothetical protein K2M39_05805 [Muribaculaceae bacterium]|nr:hypothetical protein [Muribaculaceae bacterium]